MVKKKEKGAVDGLDIVKKNIEKRYGGVLTTMGNKDAFKIDTISTGCIGLDVALGRGGIARGRVYEIYGAPSGGKSTLAMSIIANAQKQGLNCIFVDAEHCADPDLFSAMGVDLNKLDVIRGHHGEENLNILQSCIETGEVDVAVVDSVTALVPQAEAEAGMDDSFMGLLARLMSKTCRKFVPIASKTNTLVIFINQVRSTIGGYGNPHVTTGGVALDFFATGRIEVSGGKAKNTHILDDNGEIIGHETTFKVQKNKLSVPFRSATVPLIYGVGYDSHLEVLKIASELGVVEKAGTWYKYDGENIGQGEHKAANELSTNKKLFKKIRDQVIDMVGLKEHYEQASKRSV